ncbi:MAG: hypothetical protein D6690_02940 [Nitrospirae bacterium]|nr:MAG: hypothetical protein D6690_02940 [Nitrospirota bacterium]
MTDLLEFVGGLLDGLGLVALAIMIGGIGYTLTILRIRCGGLPYQNRLGALALSFTFYGALALGGVRFLQLLLKPLALADATSFWALERFIRTHVFQLNAVSLGLICLLAVQLERARRSPARRGIWLGILLTLAAFLVNEAGLSHASSRLADGTVLMVGTIVHVLGATIWAGGIVHLLLSWHALKKHEDAATSVWPQLVARFSPLGIVSMMLVVSGGSYLAWQYVGAWHGLLGTGYGNMLLVKIGLFIGIMGLAALNLFAGRRWVRTGSTSSMTTAVPIYIQVEIVLAIAMLFSASTLTSFPPAVDVLEAAATPQEVWTMFSPKLPHLAGPEQVMIEAPELTDLRTGTVGRKPDMSWDRFNHNASGVIVLILAGLALLDWSGRVTWARHWPMLFVAFSLLIIVFANPDHWPLGPASFWESFQSTEVVQHWLAGGVVFGLGWFEWWARRCQAASSHVRFVFPILCIAGGIILLTHSHSINELKTEFLVQSTHVAMGWLGVLAGCGRWMELQLPPPQARMAGLFSIIAIMLVGWILLFYINPELPEPVGSASIEG